MRINGLYEILQEGVLNILLFVNYMLNSPLTVKCIIKVYLCKFIYLFREGVVKHLLAQRL